MKLTICNHRSLAALLASVVLALLASCAGDEPLTPQKVTYTLVSAFPNLEFDEPVDLQDPGDGTNRLFVVERKGLIRVFDNSPTTASANAFLSIERRVGDSAYIEKGLLSLAFDPHFSTNGYFYVYYTATSPQDSSIESRLSRFTVTPPDGNIADRNSEEVVLSFEQPANFHNGGQIAFDENGYLYFGFGDGGPVRSEAQNLSNLLGTVIRIDVSTLPYTIPDGNPYKNSVQPYRKEIFAHGFRNPWRMTIDRVTGRIWVGDVGSGSWEEIDIVDAGANYGWNCREGTHEYEACSPVGELIDPVWDYSHDVGTAVVGGYVYRGPLLTPLVGKYVYSDYTGRRIWALTYDGGVASNELVIKNTGIDVSSFGVDNRGVLYICEYNFTGAPSKIYKLKEAFEEASK